MASSIFDKDDYRLSPQFAESAAARLVALGCTMKFKDPVTKAHLTTHAPVTLQPIQLTKASYAAVTEIAPLWNTVIDRVARDFQFVCDTLEGSAASDPEFTGRYVQMLKDIYMQQNEDGKTSSSYQKLMLGMFRSDYLRNANSTGPEDDWKHVEINTIAVSFAGLNPPVNEFHKFVAAEAPTPDAAHKAFGGGALTAANLEEKLVRSESDVELPKAMAAAHQAFVEEFCAKSNPRKQQDLPVKIVLVAQEGERNTADQFILMHQVLLKYKIQSVRMTMKEIAEELSFEENDKDEPRHAIIGEGSKTNNKFYVSLFYFRCSYTVKDFPTEKEWQGRELLERSSAVKCPSLPYYLCTMKKIQKALFDFPTLVRFSKNEAEAKMLSRSFVGQFSLEKTGDEFTESKIADAIANPHKYVLKPQLEGGGNLVHGEEMLRDLQITKEQDPKHFSQVRNEYILMERINVKELEGLLFRRDEAFPFFFKKSGNTDGNDGAVIDEGLCYELGTFGTLLSDGLNNENGGGEKLNRYAGYLFRTKRTKDEDGGVMTGVACLDSLALVD